MKEDAMRGITLEGSQACIAGVPVADLAAQCGTPLYIYDETQLSRQMDAYRQFFQSEQFSGRVVYATKAFNCIAMLQLCEKHGIYTDAVSMGELYTAKKAGIDMETVYFHGNNKSFEELKASFEYKVGTLICDSLEEVRRLCLIAGSDWDHTIRVLLRLNPLVDTHTHKYIQTAAPDSKFGMPIQKQEDIYEAASLIENTPHLKFAGFHSHIGSQLFETAPFLQEIDELTDFIDQFQKTSGLQVEELDLGGGFGVWYTENDTPLPIREVCRTLIDACRKSFEARKLDISIVSIEPGRSMVAEAGYLLYTVTMTKQALKDRFLFVDGGMSDLIRPALYEARYTADLANRMDQPKTELVTVGGKCCESGDIVIRDILLPKAEPGDLLLIYTAGAYGYSMAGNYNKLPIPGVVFVKDGTWRWVIRPQSLEEMIARELGE